MPVLSISTTRLGAPRIFSCTMPSRSARTTATSGATSSSPSSSQSTPGSGRTLPPSALTGGQSATTTRAIVSWCRLDARLDLKRTPPTSSWRVSHSCGRPSRSHARSRRSSTVARSAMPVLISCDGHTVSTPDGSVPAATGGRVAPLSLDCLVGFAPPHDPRMDSRRVHDQHRPAPARRGPDPRLPLHALLLGRWPLARARGLLDRALAPFGLYHPSGQVGFARVVTVVRAPELKHVRRWMLGTRDAHDLYRRFGFAEPAPGLLMEKIDPDSDR